MKMPVNRNDLQAFLFRPVLGLLKKVIPIVRVAKVLHFPCGPANAYIRTQDYPAAGSYAP